MLMIVISYNDFMIKNRKLASLIITLVVVLASYAIGTFAEPHQVVSPETNSVPVTASATPSSAANAIPELAGAKCQMRGRLPDPVCTPGSIDPAVTDDNVATTICVRGYTATIRPSSSYTNRLKRQQMIEYGFTDSISNHEEDHLISLQLGGAAADPTNLWPQPDASPNEKDAIENFLRAAVCAGRISLSEAQRRIAADWTTANAGLVTSKP